MRRDEPKPSPLSLESLRRLLHPAVRALSSLGVSPNAITAAGWGISLLSALLFAAGEIRLAGVVMLLGGLCDALDGAVARELGRTSEFGAFLDSTLDRVSESAILIGLIFFFAVSGRPGGALLAGAAMAASLLTSYTRARAESLGYGCNVGVLGRAGRVVLLGLAAVAGLPLAGLGLVALGASATSLQRVLHVRRLYLSGGRARGAAGGP